MLRTAFRVVEGERERGLIERERDQKKKKDTDRERKRHRQTDRA